MAPEQLLGEHVGFASDLYSVGACLYFALAGRKPFEAKSQGEIAYALMQLEPEPLSTLRPDVGALGRVVHRALSKSPAQRFESAQAMHRAIAEAMAEGPATVDAPRHSSTPTMSAFPARATATPTSYVR